VDPGVADLTFYRSGVRGRAVAMVEKISGGDQQQWRDFFLLRREDNRVIFFASWLHPRGWRKHSAERWRRHLANGDELTPFPHSVGGGAWLLTMDLISTLAPFVTQVLLELACLCHTWWYGDVIFGKGIKKGKIHAWQGRVGWFAKEMAQRIEIFFLISILVANSIFRFELKS
jgi:hypothetical protein